MNFQMKWTITGLNGSVSMFETGDFIEGWIIFHFGNKTVWHGLSFDIWNKSIQEVNFPYEANFVQ